MSSSDPPPVAGRSWLPTEPASPTATGPPTGPSPSVASPTTGPTPPVIGQAGGIQDPVPATPTPPGDKHRRSLLLAGLCVAVAAAVVASLVTVMVVDGDDGPDTVIEPRDPILTPEGVMDIQGIVDNVKQSVVTINTSSNGSMGVFEGAGTGIILSEDGHVLTNAHVIRGMTAIDVRLLDGSEHTASLVGSEQDQDLAVIQIEGAEDLQPARLGRSDSLSVGDPVIAIGNAFNLGGQPTVTQGIVSALDRSIQGEDPTSSEPIRLENLLQTDAAINNGNSGGPLVDAAGEVIGVNTAIISDGQNIGFSIAIDPVRSLIDELRAGGGDVTGDTAFLGVSTQDVGRVEPAVREQFGITVDEGAFVAEVSSGTAADEAGLQPGDVVIEADGEAISSSNDLVEAIANHEPGDEIELTIVREGDEETVTATLGRRGG